MAQQTVNNCSCSVTDLHRLGWSINVHCSACDKEDALASGQQLLVAIVTLYQVVQCILPLQPLCVPDPSMSHRILAISPVTRRSVEVASGTSASRADALVRSPLKTT